MKINAYRKTFFLPVILLLISGCATWSKVGGPYNSNSALYKVDLPWGWARYRDKDLLITRDGLLLEKIEVGRLNVNRKLEHTKKKFISGMLAEEIADIEIDDMRSDSDITNLEIIENIPLTISGQSSFRLIYSFRSKDGLKYKCVHYGFGYDDWIYSLIYKATADYYFEKYVDEFNEVVKSFKFLPNIEGKTDYLPPIPEEAPASLAYDEAKIENEDQAEGEKLKIEPIEGLVISVQTEPEEPVPAAAQPVITTYAEYYRFLYKTISQAVVKPAEVGSGTVNVELTLSSDGTLEDVRVLEGSAEEEALRNAVTEAINKSAPFPPFPDDMKAEAKKTFTIMIEFRQNR